MSLLLCRQENVKHPFYVELLGIYVYSSQELCYVIYNNPLLVMEGFVDDILIRFINDELQMDFLASKLIKLERAESSTDEKLLTILFESYYYSPSEIVKYRQRLASIRKLPPAEYEKSRSDYFFGIRQYEKAIQGYRKILETADGRRYASEFLGKVWHNMGAAYARMFQFYKAVEALENAYECTKEYNILNKLYVITLLNPDIKLNSRYEAMLDEEVKNEWNKSYKEIMAGMSASQRAGKLEALFGKDPVKRFSGAAEIIKQWKQEYRKM